MIYNIFINKRLEVYYGRIIYKKKYNDAGTYTWEEWSGGNSTKLTNRDFTIKRV